MRIIKIFFQHLGGSIALGLVLTFTILALGKPFQVQAPKFFLDIGASFLLIGLPVSLALLMSAFACWLIIESQHLHGHLSHDHIDSGPQKMHTEPTPRIGGLAIAAGLLIAGVGFHLLKANRGELSALNTMNYFLLLLSALPAFMGGVIEDLTKRVGPLDRLMLTMASGALAAWLLGASLNRVDVPWLDAWLTNLPLFTILFTAFAVAGVANSINIIDGFNGLAAGYAIIVLLAMACVGYLAQDSLIVEICLSLACTLVGFLIWNWPSGRIFLGDGGAYLVGFLLAEISVLLVMRNPDVSAWLPFVLLIYPISETLYSVYRRKFHHKTNAGEPDREHLHHLIHARIVHKHLNDPKLRDDKRTNPKVGKYIGVANLLIAATALLAWDSPQILVGLALLYGVLYVVAYRALARDDALE